jgi:hypothetical protein
MLVNDDHRDEVLMVRCQEADDKAALKARHERHRKGLPRLLIARHIEGRLATNLDDTRQQSILTLRTCYRGRTRGTAGPGVTRLQDRRAAALRLSLASQGREADYRLADRPHDDGAVDLAADPTLAEPRWPHDPFFSHDRPKEGSHEALFLRTHSKSLAGWQFIL